MAASTLAHGSAAWGSAAILAGLPSISGRGGDVALEGPGSVEVVPLLPLGSGAIPELGGAVVLAGGASGVVVVLATEVAAGAAPVISRVPPALGGSVALGAVEAPAAGCVSVDARSSSPVARGGVAGAAEVAGLGPGVVCPVFLLFLLFLPFFSSFFSSASLERAGGRKIRKEGKSKKRDFCSGTLTRRLTRPILFCSGGQRMLEVVRRIRLPASCRRRP
jgi:hypothetical protein